MRVGCQEKKEGVGIQLMTTINIHIPPIIICGNNSILELETAFYRYIPGAQLDNLHYIRIFIEVFKKHSPSDLKNNNNSQKER